MSEIVLAGKPNVGKSTLLNALTGAHEKVGNWQGVTTERSEKSFFLSGERHTAVDLPGIRDIRSLSAEEGEAARALTKKNYDAMIIVVEAKELLSSLEIISALCAIKTEKVLFINLYARFLKRGGKIDGQKLANYLGVKVMTGEANSPAAAKAAAGLAIYGKAENIKNAEVYFPDESGRYNGLKKTFSTSLPSGIFTPPYKKTFSDKLFSNPFSCYLGFLFAVVAVFYLSFGKYGIGSPLSEAISRLIALFRDFVRSFLTGKATPFLTAFICDGLISGLGAALSFLPQIAVMSLSVDFLDQSGYIARLALSTDAFLTKFGLSGKAVYTLIGGYGCTAVAAATSLSIADEGVRKRTALSLPFISCSARTPVYAVIAKFCFPNLSPFIMAAIYILSVVLALVHSLILYKTTVKTPVKLKNSDGAELRFPPVKLLLGGVKRTITSFILRLGTVIVIASAAVFLLGNVTADFKYSPSGENCLLYYISTPFSLLLKPVGLGDWRYSAALLSGIFAKEGVAATLTQLFPNGMAITFSQGLALTVFCYLYTPCVSAIAALKRVTGLKAALLSAFWQLFVASLSSYLVFFALALFGL